MKYQYTATPSHNTKGKLTKRPIVELELIGKNDTINALGLIDSGADTTMMNIEYAKVLGIDLEKAHKKEFLGIGSARVTTYISSKGVIKGSVHSIDKSLLDGHSRGHGTEGTS